MQISMTALSALALGCLGYSSGGHAQSTTPARAATTPSRTSAPIRPRRAESLDSRLDYVPTERTDDLRNYIVRARAQGGTLFNSPDGQTNYRLVRRTAESEVEEHSRWDDLIIVQSGAGEIQVGPKTKGSRFMAAGELRGGTITAPSRVSLRVGDVVRIPAGVPHSFAPSSAEPWEFLLIKVRRPNKPLKRPPESQLR